MTVVRQRALHLVAVLAMAFIAVPLPAVTRARYLMGTVCEITASDERQIETAFDECDRVEKLLSTWRDDSALAALNRTQKTTDRELVALLQTTLTWRETSGGAFDPLVAPLIEAWRTRAEGALPSDAAVAAARSRMARANVSLGDGAVALANGAAFEEGGFGKGYALDRMMNSLSGSDAVLNFGGQLLVRGAVPVSVADPEHRDRPVVTFTITDASLSTSSGSEKTFEAGGQRFSHIIDPRTGRALPPRGSASAVSTDALTADILSTALYVMGADAGLQWADAHGVAALFISPDHIVRPSKVFRMRTKDLAVVDDKFKLKD